MMMRWCINCSRCLNKTECCGYHLDSLGQSVVASMRGMMSLAPAANGSQANAMLQPEQMHKVEKLCEQVRQLHDYKKLCPRS
eukprot:1157756-Pelagomonas_calceolata.AAC.7